MKNFRKLFALLFLATAYCLLPTADASAQTQTGEAPIKWVSALPATCVTTNKTRVLIYKYTATTGIYYCSAANTWTQVGTSTMSYPALASDGSASAPAFSFSSDTDTGMYRSGANTLNFATGGTLRATLSSGGLFTTTGGLSSTTGAFTSPITSTQGTITTSQPFIDHTATWNDGAVTFSNIKSNVTSSASAAGSLLIDLQVGGTSQFKVSKAGLGTFTGGVVATTGTFSGAVSGTTGTFSGVVDGANGTAGAPAFTFTSDTDTGIFRSGANALGFSTGGTERGTLSSAGLFTTTGGISTTTVTTSGGVELGNASDTTIARSAAGTVTIEGNTVITSADMLRSYLAADVTYNNTAALANTSLNVTVASSGVYAVDVILYTTNVASALNVDFGGTATMTNGIGEWHSRKENGPTDNVTATVTPVSTDFTNATFDAAPLSVYQFTGTIEVNAGGTFILRGAQRSAAASNTVISRGSRMILTKLN